jgi:AcrR family transcriptional regulator
MPSEAETRARILAAAVEVATVHGISRLALADVARGAGLSRQTLYNHFPSKQALLAAAVLHEAQVMVDDVVRAVEPHDDARDALEAAVLRTLVLTREHPVLDRLVRTEPESLLPLLTSDGGPVVGMVRSVVEGVIASRVPDLDAVALRRAADALTRLLVSYAVNAPDDPPEVVAAFLADFLMEGVAGRSDAARR